MDNAIEYILTKFAYDQRTERVSDLEYVDYAVQVHLVEDSESVLHYGKIRIAYSD